MSTFSIPLQRGEVDRLRSLDLQILDEILSDGSVSPAVRIQAVQTREKVLAALEAQIVEKDTPVLDKVLKAMGGN